jgi:hypothetical protein
MYSKRSGPGFRLISEELALFKVQPRIKVGEANLGIWLGGADFSLVMWRFV